MAGRALFYPYFSQPVILLSSSAIHPQHCSVPLSSHLRSNSISRDRIVSTRLIIKQIHRILIFQEDRQICSEPLVVSSDYTPPQPHLSSRRLPESDKYETASRDPPFNHHVHATCFRIRKVHTPLVASPLLTLRSRTASPPSRQNRTRRYDFYAHPQWSTSPTR